MNASERQYFMHLSYYLSIDESFNNMLKQELYVVQRVIGQIIKKWLT